MLRLFCILLLGLGLLGPLPAAPTAALIPLRVLYVGDRPERYVAFLQEHFVGVESLRLTQEAPKPTEPCQVVLLDWPQTQGLRERPLDLSPLGRRENWRQPTVLLGSAGLNLAVSWRLKGGAGCTCLAPVDYDRRLDLPFDAPDFIPRAIAALRIEGTARDAAILLQRYVIAGPDSNASADAWSEWWQANGPYLFFSELGRYRWYLDPLAKARGIPTRDLRGPARADLTR